MQKLLWGLFFVSLVSSASGASSLARTLKNYRYHQLTKGWITYFTKKDPERFERFMRNGERFKDIVGVILRRYKLPQELYYLGLIESGYYLKNRSHASAVGPWQFVEGTAEHFDLKVNHYFDERMSIYKSTHAAAKYLKVLYKQFKGWELALAAYNSGPGRVRQAIRKGRTRNYRLLCGKKLLPPETCNYFPKLAAARLVAKSPKKYGIKELSPPEIFTADVRKVYLKETTTVQALAQKLNVSTQLLRKYNPDIRSQRLYANSKHRYKVYLPKHLARIYRVKSGDSLLAIATKNKVPVKRLLAMNKLTLKSTIHPGQKLKLQAPVACRTLASQQSQKIYRKYQVKKGDTLSELAEKFKLAQSEIIQANKLKKKTLFIGQTLRLPQKTYTVKPGDALSHIAKRFGTNVQAIVAINDLESATIHPNQTLHLPH